MKINIEQLKCIRMLLTCLADDNIDAEWEGFLNDDDDDDLPEEMELDEIRLSFPDDQVCFHISPDEFLFYMGDIDSIRRVGETIVRTDHIVQSVISSSRMGYTGFESELSSCSFVGEGLAARVVKMPFLVGVMNARENRYEKDFGIGACEPYTAIEIRLREEKDDVYLKNLIEQICFYLTDKTGVAIYPWEGPNINEIYDRMDEYYEDDESEKNEDEVEKVTALDVAILPSYSPLLRMFRQAKGVDDPEIQFLQYYKIIEYVSPVVAKSVAYDHLNRRLDLLPSVNRNYKYLDSILDVARKYDKDLRDDSLAEAVITNCVDVVPLYEFLPKRMLKKVKSELRLQKDVLTENDVTEEQVRVLQYKISTILYATRNSIVHAKSNYEETGNELNVDELEDGNKMLEIIVRSIINWNQRQAEGFRV